MAGTFAREGSSGARARRYDPTYARRVGKSPSGPVDLTISGQLLRSIKGNYTIREEGELQIFVELTNAAARAKKEFLQDLGVGPRRIKRRFIYWTQGEAKEIMNTYFKILFSESKK